MRSVSFVLITLLLLSACSARSASVLPSRTLERQTSPLVWERGAPPVQWNFIADPNPQRFGTTYAWPVGQSSSVAIASYYGDVNNYEDAALSIINMSGSVTSNQPTLGEGPVNKMTSCDHGQLCIAGRLPYVPNGHYASPQGVADIAGGTGSDDVWFTTANWIVHGLNQKETIYRTPNDRDRTADISVGSDGNIWATVSPYKQSYYILAKLNPTTSVITEYPLHLQQNPPQLVADSTGNVWFVINQVLYDLSISNAQVKRTTLPLYTNGFLTIAPDNTLWMSYNFGLLHVTKSGTLLGKVQCPASVCYQPGYFGQLTIGPDGNVWFAYSGGSSGNGPSVNSGLGVYMQLSMNVKPSTVSLTAAGKTQTITVSETNYTGAWTASSTNTKVVAAPKWTNKNTLLITAVGVGSGRVIIRDTKQNYYSVPVTVQ